MCKICDHSVPRHCRLITSHPELQAMFPILKDRQMDQLIRDRDPRLLLQALRIMRALDTMFLALDQPDKIVDYCYQVGHRHHQYGVKSEHFSVSLSRYIK